MAITSAAVASGSADVNYSVDVNEGPDRIGALMIAGHQVTVTQNQGCWFKLDPGDQAFGRAGGAGSVALASDQACQWTSSSSVDWITITSAWSGTGSGTLTFAVAPLKKKKRTGTLTIGSTIFTVTQSKN